MIRGLWVAALIVLLYSTTAVADISRLTPADPRLDKKITLDVDHTKLQDVANMMIMQSGVTIKTGSGERDWKVRERRVTIHAKDVTVGSLLDKIAALLGFCLSREGKDKEWSYVIWQDKKSRDLENEMLTAEKEAEAQRIAKTRKAGIDLAKEALDMSPADAMKQKDKDPLLAYLGGTKAGRGCAQLLSSFDASFPTEYDLMMRGKRAYLPLSALPSNLRQALADATSGGLANAFKGAAGADMTPYQMVMTPATDVFDSSVPDYLPDVLRMGMMVVMGLAPGQAPNANGWMGGGNMMTLCPLMDGNSPLGKFAGRTLLSADSGMSLDSLNKQMGDELSDPALLQSLTAHDSPTEKAPPTDPDLTREVEIKDLSKDIKPGMSQEQRLGIMMAEAARATGYPVLLESFKKLKPLDLFVRPGKQPVYKLLIGLEKAGYTWIKDPDKTIRIRPEDWALRRSCEVSEGFVGQYKSLLEKKGFLTLDDVAGLLGGLTDDQILITFDGDYEMFMTVGNILGDAPERHEMLRAYASFAAQQKAALGEEAGLRFSDLSNEQWEHISNIIGDQMNGSYIADGSIRLIPQTDKQIQAKELARVFEIRTLTGDQKEPSKLNVAIGLPTQDQAAAALAQWNKAVETALKAQAEKPAPTK